MSNLSSNLDCRQLDTALCLISIPPNIMDYSPKAIGPFANETGLTTSAQSFKDSSSALGQLSIAGYVIAISIIASTLWTRWQSSKQNRRMKLQYNCAETKQYPHEDALGTDLARLRQRAVREGFLFKLYKSQFDTYGKTWSEVWRGKTLFNTMDPANIQHVASTAAEDFGKDSDRETAQWPLLGPSIFSDGEPWTLSRRLVKPIFTRTELTDLDSFAASTDKFLKLIPEKMDETFDIQPLLHRLVRIPWCQHWKTADMAVVSGVLYGIYLRTLSEFSATWRVR